MRNLIFSTILCVVFSVASFGQCGSAGHLVKNPITGLLDCTANSGIPPSGAAGGVLGGSYPTPTFAGGASFPADATLFLNGIGTFTAVSTANSHTTFSNVASVAITLTGVADHAVVACFDNSTPPQLIIPDHIQQTDANTITAFFVPNATGYCNASTGVGATGATGATGPAGPAGGVSSIATTSPITGGTITTTGTIACATCTTNAAALTANQLVIGGGSQASATLGSLGTTTTLLHGNAGGAPTFGAVSLSADVSGTLADGSLSANVPLLNATNAFTGGDSFSKNLTFSGTLSPTALAGDVNDYNPTGCATSLALRIDGGAADRNITGLQCAASTPVDGQIITITNIGTTNVLVLKNQSGSSTAANRFLLPADTTLPIDTALAFRYDGTSSRWRPWSRALANTGVTAGTYQSLTVDVAGRVTGGAARTINTTSPVTGGGALSADLTLACPTCVTLPVATGSLLVSGPASATPNPYMWSGLGGSAAVSSANSVQPFSVAGRIRNLYGLTSTTQGSGAFSCFGILLGFPLVNTTGFNTNSSFCIPPSATSGSYGPGWSNDVWHVPQGATAYMTVGKNGAGTTSASIQSASAEFVADSGYVTLLFVADNGHGPTASTTNYWSLTGNAGSFSTANTDVLLYAIPMPFAGTLSNVQVTNRATPTANATLTVQKIATGGSSAADTSLTVTVLAADTAPVSYIDTTHTDNAVAGDSYVLKIVPGASTQMGLASMSAAFTASSGTHTGVFTVVGGTQLASTKYYAPTAAVSAQTTSAVADVVMPFACSATNLYAFVDTQNGGGITSAITLEQNDADTTLTGTITSGTAIGSVLLDGTHTVNLAAGDKIAIKVVVAGGTSGKIGGISLQCN